MSLLRDRLQILLVSIKNQEIIEIHREDLLADWELAVNGKNPFQVGPTSEWEPCIGRLWSHSEMGPTLKCFPFA